MKSVVTSIYDCVSGVYTAPKLAINPQVAIREFQYACNNVQGMPVDDLKLVLIGEFDDNSGVITPIAEQVLEHGHYIKKGDSDE